MQASALTDRRIVSVRFHRSHHSYLSGHIQLDEVWVVHLELMLQSHTSVAEGLSSILDPALNNARFLRSVPL